MSSPNLTVLDHPLAFDALRTLRDKETETPDFRNACTELTRFVTYEATRRQPTTQTKIETPICETNVPISAEPNPVVVGIWRAGQIMVDAVLGLIPGATAGYLGMFRNETTHQPEFYYENLPELSDRTIYLVDPMLATGGSANLAIEKLLSRGAKVTSISLICLIASQNGVTAVNDSFPGISITAAAVDAELNENAYIVPGLGDAGDRINNT